MTQPPPKVRQRIRQLHALIGSPNENEAGNARRKLAAQLSEYGLTWNDLPAVLADADVNGGPADNQDKAEPSPRNDENTHSEAREASPGRQPSDPPGVAISAGDKIRIGSAAALLAGLLLLPIWQWPNMVSIYSMLTAPPKPAEDVVDQPTSAPPPQQQTHKGRFDPVSKPPDVAEDVPGLPPRTPPADTTIVSKTISPPVTRLDDPVAKDALRSLPAPSPPSGTRDPHLPNVLVGPPPAALSQNSSSQIRVRLKPGHGVWLVPTEINGRLTLDFGVDSGASMVSVNAEVFAELKRAGTIKETDVLAPETFTQADGSQYRADVFLIKSIKVGNVVVENVKASIAPSSAAPLLLGQAFLQRFKSWSIDNATHELLLVENEAPVRPGQTAKILPQEPAPYTPPVDRNVQDNWHSLQPATPPGNSSARWPNPPAPEPSTLHVGWIIQIGLFLTEDEAKHRLSLVQSRASRFLASAEAYTESVSKGGSILYRARIAGLAKEQAEAACTFLKSAGVDCMTIGN